ncbi:hypothetical protein B0H34DRAFT_155647 [Crassisporium funariophilum]|nr:hypothetical protein B0H34DRAFT_155647 [Crassisporium funariophilum]
MVAYGVSNSAFKKPYSANARQVHTGSNLYRFRLGSGGGVSEWTTRPWESVIKMAVPFVNISLQVCSPPLWPHSPASGFHMEQDTLSWVKYHRSYWSTIALSALVWDTTLCIKNEYKYIWRSPFITNQWVYLVARYFGLLSQTTNHIFIIMQLYGPHTSEWCSARFRLESIACATLLGVIEILLMLRVYAFYNKSRKVAISLSVWFVLEFGVNGYLAWKSPSFMTFTSSCALAKAPKTAYSYVLIVLCTQAITMALIVHRSRVVAPDGWKTVPIVYLIIRDSSLLFCGTSTIFLVSIPYAIIENQVPIIVPALSATWSIAACRITLNLQSMSRLPPCSDRGDVELTIPQFTDASFGAL